jgi:hypothetical protein
MSPRVSILSDGANMSSTGDLRQQQEYGWDARQPPWSALREPSVALRASQGKALPHLPGLLARWGDYCEALFEELAAKAPDELGELVRAGQLRPARLTYAAEILGREAPARVAVPPLRALLKHASPLAREGAVCGLAFHTTEDVRRLLEAVAVSDLSPGVRAAAVEALDRN